MIMTTITTIFTTLVFFTILTSVQTLHQFQVGGPKGWITPSSNNTNHFNEWASRNRFTVNDTLRFEYRKDSVLVVSKEEHEKCKASNPVFFADDGDTSFRLRRSGYFYFISGNTGHCERGLKMIVKVLEVENVGDQTANQTSAKSEAASVLKMDSDTLSQTLMIVGIIAMFTVFYM